MEIRRFGIGHRRPGGPEGSHGLSTRVIHSDARGVITELAFGRDAAFEAHLNPNTTWFVVIEGGGFVRVADERARVAAGEAVLFAPGEIHAAWTEGSEMRAIVVEFGGADDALLRGIVEGNARRLLAASVDTEVEDPGPRRVERGEGRLAPRGRTRTMRDGESGEPI